MAVTDIDSMTPTTTVVPDNTERDPSQNAVHTAAQDFSKVIAVKNLPDIPHVISVVMGPNETIGFPDGIYPCSQYMGYTAKKTRIKWITFCFCNDQ